jgi:DnaJ family protein B protein 4
VLTYQPYPQISEAFEVLSDKQKRSIYDQLGEEGLKGKGAPPPGSTGGASGGFPGFGASPGGPTFTFTSSGPGGGSFNPSDPNIIFESFFGPGGPGLGGLFGMPSGGSKKSSGAKSYSMYDDDDDTGGGGGSYSGFNGYSGFGGMPEYTKPRTSSSRSRPGASSSGFGFGAPPNSSPKPSQFAKPAEITKPLKLSLADLYTGTRKHLKIGRKLLNGRTEDKVLEIDVLPGWKAGTKVRFPKAGNEVPGGESQDLVFVVEEKPDPTGKWKREGDDLFVRVDLPLVEALCGAPDGSKLTKSLQLLDGRRLQVAVPLGIVKPEQTSIVSGEGMPVRKGGKVERKGDLRVKWNVVFPNQLGAGQKEGLRKMLA